MDLEARSLQPNVKAMLLAKLREYKSDLTNLKREVKRISSPNHEAAREELMEAGMADAYKVFCLTLIVFFVAYFCVPLDLLKPSLHFFWGLWLVGMQ